MTHSCTSNAPDGARVAYYAADALMSVPAAGDGTSMVVQGNVSQRKNIDLCGNLYDTYEVISNEHIVNLRGKQLQKRAELSREQRAMFFENFQCR